MKIINYISIIAIPLLMIIGVIYGLVDKKKIYDIFVEGVKEGMEIVIKLFPTLLGIFLAVGALRSSGILDIVTTLLSGVTSKIGFPSEVIPLALLRPISGSASLAIATDIMKTYGVDSKIGLIASTIMGSTETTFYTIAVYTSCIGVKKNKICTCSTITCRPSRNDCFSSNLEYNLGCFWGHFSKTSFGCFWGHFTKTSFGCF